MLRSVSDVILLEDVNLLSILKENKAKWLLIMHTKSCRAPAVGIIFSQFFSEISLLFPAFSPAFWDYQSLLFPYFLLESRWKPCKSYSPFLKRNLHSITLLTVEDKIISPPAKMSVIFNIEHMQPHRYVISWHKTSFSTF